MLLDSDPSHAVEVLNFISNPDNFQLLRLLAKRCSYPRELARILGKSESTISRSLRRAEELGLVSSKWTKIDAGKKTISAKLYCANTGRLVIDLLQGRLSVEPPLHRRGARRQAGLWAPLGRKVELGRLKAASEYARVILVYGPPKSGKTHLVKYAVSEYFSDRPVIYINISPGETMATFSRILAIRLAELGYDLDFDDFDALTYRDEVARALDEARAVVVLDDLHNAFRDSRLARFIRWLAGEAYSRRYTLILVSRTRPPAIGVWRDKTLEISLGPVTPRVFAEIARRYTSIPVEEEHAEMLAKRLPLLPGYAVMYAKILEETGDPEKAASMLESAVSRGLLGTVLDDDLQWMIVSLLAVADKPVPQQAVCSAIGSRGRKCEQALRQLALAGVVKYRGGEVYLDDYYHGLVKTQIREDRELKSRLAQALAAGDDHYWKGEAARLYAESCDVVGLARLVRERLSTGSAWPFANLQAYTTAIEEVLARCPLSDRDRVILEAELTIFRGILERPIEAAVKLEEAYERERASSNPDRRLLVRLAALAAIAYTHAGRTDRAEELLTEAEEEAYKCRDRDALITFYTNKIALILALADKRGDTRLVWEALNTARAMEDLFAEELESWDKGWLYLWVLSVIADLERQLGLLDNARDKLERLWDAVRRAPRSEADPLTYNVAVSLAYLYAELGRVDDALRVLEEAGDMALRLTSSGLRREFLEWISADTAIMYALKCDVEKAASMFPRGICEERGESPLWNWRCALYKALVLGEPVEAPASSPSVARLVRAAAACQLAES